MTALAVDPDRIFEHAVRCLVDLGYAKALGQESGAYGEALRRPVWDPALAAEGYDRLVLVDPRVPLGVPLRHGNVVHHAPHARIEDVAPPPAEWPYWLQVQTGERYRGRAVREAVAAFAPGERGLTLVEGVALVLQHSDVVSDDRGVDLPGSRLAGVGVACMAVWYGRVGLFGRSEGVASPLYGAATVRGLKAGPAPGKPS